MKICTSYKTVRHHGSFSARDSFWNLKSFARCKKPPLTSCWLPLQTCDADDQNTDEFPGFAEITSYKSTYMKRCTSSSLFVTHRFVYAFHLGVSAGYWKNPVPGCVGGGASTKLVSAFPLEEESFKNWAHCVSVYTTTENEKSAGVYRRQRRSSNFRCCRAYVACPVLSSEDVLQQRNPRCTRTQPFMHNCTVQQQSFFSSEMDPLYPFLSFTLLKLRKRKFTDPWVIPTQVFHCVFFFFAVSFWHIYLFFNKYICLVLISLFLLSRNSTFH